MEFKADKFRGKMKQLFLPVSLTDRRNMVPVKAANLAFQALFKSRLAGLLKAQVILVQPSSRRKKCI